MPDIGSASARGDNLPPRTVSSGLSLWLELKDPCRMGDLLAYLVANDSAIRQALRSLNYVHFSRFLPTRGWDSEPPPAVAALQVITEFDGDFDAYVLDFALVIGDQFDHILDYVKDRPPSPVNDHPAAFLEFIKRHNVGYTSSTPGSVGVQCAYPDLTVIDIVGSGGLLPRADEPPPPAVAVNRSDVQANVLQGLNMAHGSHLGLKFTQPDGARAFLAALLSGQGGVPQVSDATRWALGVRPACALTVGLTFKGLRALGLSAADEEAFQLSFPAFKSGPDSRRSARLNGDVGTSEPDNWQLGGTRKAVLIVVSVYAAGRLAQRGCSARPYRGGGLAGQCAARARGQFVSPGALRFPGWSFAAPPGHPGRTGGQARHAAACEGRRVPAGQRLPQCLWWCQFAGRAQPRVG